MVPTRRSRCRNETAVNWRTEATGCCRYSRESALAKGFAINSEGWLSWLKAPDSKSGVRVTVPWVRIPPLPLPDLIYWRSGSPIIAV